jgi:glycosyltransferase involved in cell wall biosynthesis
VVLWAVLRSKKVIVPSNDVKSDFLSHYPYVSEDKFVLAYEGVDPAFLKCNLDHKEVLSKYSIKKPFLLYISSMYEHKNVPRLLKVFKRLMEEHGFEGQLIMIGKRDKFSERIYEKIQNEGLGDRVLMPGMETYVTDEETVALRKEALAYVFPSLKEGFSLTPMEAQVNGLPCVISSIPSHQEIYGDSVYFFDPEDVDDMLSKINDVIENEALRKELVKKGYENAKKFSWEETARITLEVFKEYL